MPTAMVKALRQLQSRPVMGTAQALARGLGPGMGMEMVRGLAMQARTGTLQQKGRRREEATQVARWGPRLLQPTL